jgi:hypothetical protein
MMRRPHRRAASTASVAPAALARYMVLWRVRVRVKLGRSGPAESDEDAAADLVDARPGDLLGATNNGTDHHTLAPLAPAQGATARRRDSGRRKAGSRRPPVARRSASQPDREPGLEAQQVVWPQRPQRTPMRRGGACDRGQDAG